MVGVTAAFALASQACLKLKARQELTKGAHHGVTRVEMAINATADNILRAPTQDLSQPQVPGIATHRAAAEAASLITAAAAAALLSALPNHLRNYSRAPRDLGHQNFPMMPLRSIFDHFFVKSGDFY